MSGDSKTTTTQQSQTEPWLKAQPFLGGVLGQLQGGLSNTGLNGNETRAINSLVDNAGSANRFAPQISDYASNLLAGGGALSQAPAVQAALDQYSKNTSALANNTNYDPRNTPGFGDVISGLSSDITNSINGQFAAAGRDFSGMNTKTLAEGLSKGLAPVYQSQYNQNVQNQQNAARDIYNAATGNAGLLSGFQQQYLQNQGAGIGASGSALDAENNGANATLAAEAARRGIPVQALGLLANIGIPIAGLGSQSSGTSNTTYSPSFWQTLGQAGNAFQSFMPKAPIKFGG